jgi:hypothetical protein
MIHKLSLEEQMNGPKPYNFWDRIDTEFGVGITVSTTTNFFKGRRNRGNIRRRIRRKWRLFYGGKMRI